MLNQDVDELTKQLKGIRLEQAKAVKKPEEINKADNNLLKELHRSKTKNQGTCPFVKGNIVAIINNLRDKFGILGKVEKIGIMLVTIVNNDTKKPYSRAWWNLRLVESVAVTISLPPRK